MLLLIYLDVCSHIYCLFCLLNDLKKVVELLITLRSCMFYIQSCIYLWYKFHSHNDFLTHI